MPPRSLKFGDGDLACINAGCDRTTRESVILFDWENTGYMPDFCREICTGYHSVYYGYYDDEALIDQYVAELERVHGQHEMTG